MRVLHNEMFQTWNYYYICSQICQWQIGNYDFDICFKFVLRSNPLPKIAVYIYLTNEI